MIDFLVPDIWRDALPPLLAGLGVSVRLTAVSLVLGFPLGLLLAVAVQSRQTVVRAAGLLVVECGRGAPLLVLLMLIYFGLPQGGLTLGQMTTAVIAFTWSTGAYSSEIFRASLESVAPGQREAADALGLDRKAAFFSVVLPQAMRIAIPPLMNISIQIFQATSLAFVTEDVKQAETRLVTRSV